MDGPVGFYLNNLPQKIGIYICTSSVEGNLKYVDKTIH